MTEATAIVRQAGEGERSWFAGGGVFTWKVTAAESGGAFFAFEDELAEGKTTPLHTHPNEDELIYVLDGELLAHVDGEQRRVGAGGVLFAPRGVPHAFMVVSPAARVLAFQTPGTGEAFYRAASEPATSDADATRPGDFARLRQVAETSPAIEILGPPPFERVAPAGG